MSSGRAVDSRDELGRLGASISGIWDLTCASSSWYWARGFLSLNDPLWPTRAASHLFRPDVPCTRERATCASRRPPAPRRAGGDRGRRGLCRASCSRSPRWAASPRPAQAPQRSTPMPGARRWCSICPPATRPAAAAGMRAAPRACAAWAIPRPTPLLALALVEAEHGAGRVAAARAALDQAAAQLGADDLRVRGRPRAAGLVAGRRAPAIADALGALADQNPAEPLPAFERGLALLFAGRAREADDRAARVALRRCREGFYAARADNLLHPGMRQGLPALVRRPCARLGPGGGARAPRPRAPARSPTRSSRWPRRCRARAGGATPRTRRRARSRPIRTTSTRRSRWPCSASTRTSPELAFGAIGTIIRAQRAAPSPRLHLGLLLSWLRERDKAREQYRLAASLDPDGRDRPPRGRPRRARLKSLIGFLGSDRLRG